MPIYTPKQGQYLAFIDYYIRLHGQSPAESDIQRYFRVSPPSVHQMIVTLTARGFISREPGKARSIKLLIPKEQLPRLGATNTPPAADSLVQTQSAITAISFETAYPTISAWVTTHGWIEIGQDEYSRSMVRALDEGGMVWEGNITYVTMDDLLKDLERNLAKWVAGST